GQQAGLAGPGGPDQGDHLAGSDGEVHGVQGRDGPVAVRVFEGGSDEVQGRGAGGRVQGHGGSSWGKAGAEGEGDIEGRAVREQDSPGAGRCGGVRRWAGQFPPRAMRASTLVVRRTASAEPARPWTTMPRMGNRVVWRVTRNGAAWAARNPPAIPTAPPIPAPRSRTIAAWVMASRRM